MPIITISKGSYSKGKEVAEKVSQKLGYGCISRDVLLEASEEFNVPEIKLIRAIHNSPSILNNFTHGREKYIVYIQAALLRHLSKDNIVYHGLAGHFFVKGISHVLKVRIIADMDDRVAAEMKRENISEKEALHILKKDDDERAKWSQHLYGVDTRDPSLYDLTIHIHRLTMDHAVELICTTLKMPEFQASQDTQTLMDNLILAAEVRSKLMETGYLANVQADKGVVQVTVQTHLAHENLVAEKIHSVLTDFSGVDDIEVKIKPILPLSE